MSLASIGRRIATRGLATGIVSLSTEGFGADILRRSACRCLTVHLPEHLLDMPFAGSPLRAALVASLLLHALLLFLAAVPPVMYAHPLFRPLAAATVAAFAAFLAMALARLASDAFSIGFFRAKFRRVLLAAGITARVAGSRSAARMASSDSNHSSEMPSMSHAPRAWSTPSWRRSTTWFW